MEAVDFYSSEQTMNDVFKFEVEDKSLNIIKVIGVGGGGSNAVKNMINEGLTNISYAVINTDSQALRNSTVAIKLQIGSTGLGCGGNPELGREAAEYSEAAIRDLLDDGTKMVFITAGMGGGTGTGASPVIARIAREMDILTVGVVSLPFNFEKSPRINKALIGAKKLKENVDSLLVINNERLMEICDDKSTSVDAALNMSDKVITTATKSISEIITVEGKINRDFCDVQTVLKNGGAAMMSSGKGDGEHRVLKAMKNALNSPMLNKSEIERSQKLLYIVYQSKSHPVSVSELNEINTFMDHMPADLEVLWGLYWDETLDNEVRVDIVATGFDEGRERERNDEMKVKEIERLYDIYYNNKTKNLKTSSDIANIIDAQLNNNVINLPVESDADESNEVIDDSTAITAPENDGLHSSTMMDENTKSEEQTNAATSVTPQYTGDLFSNEEDPEIVVEETVDDITVEEEIETSDEFVEQLQKLQKGKKWYTAFINKLEDLVAEK